MGGGTNELVATTEEGEGDGLVDAEAEAETAAFLSWERELLE